MARQTALEKRLGYRFQNGALLSQALTHRSYGSPHNERLEFLGDGVLNCVIAEDLYGRFPDLTEGQLSRLRANLVRKEALSALSEGIGLSEFLHLGEGELASGGSKRPSILADTLEALFGAILLDGGYPAARQAILQAYATSLAALDPAAPAKDAKTRLQEYLQGKKCKLPEYRVVATEGQAHKQTFQVECVIADLGLSATGSGSSRRVAEQRAAEQLLKRLES